MNGSYCKEKSIWLFCTDFFQFFFSKVQKKNLKSFEQSETFLFMVVLMKFCLVSGCIDQ